MWAVFAMRRGVYLQGDIGIMNEWTDEDWRLITRTSIGERLTHDEHARVTVMITEHRGGQHPDMERLSGHWIQGYCEALVAERLHQIAAKIAQNVTWGYGVNEPSQP